MFLYTPPDLSVFTLTVRPPVKCRVEPGFSTHVYLAWPPSRQSTLFLNSFNTQHPSLLYSWHRNFHILRSISTLFWIFLQDCCVSSREIRRFDKICSWKLSNIQYFFIGLLHSFSSTHTVQCTAFLIYIFCTRTHCSIKLYYILFSESTFIMSKLFVYGVDQSMSNSEIQVFLSVENFEFASWSKWILISTRSFSLFVLSPCFLFCTTTAHV